MNNAVLFDSARKIAVVREVVRTHSQYAESDLDPDALLQEELGIDSIMLAEIIADLKKRFRGADRVSAEQFDTLGALLHGFAVFELEGTAFPEDVQGEPAPGNLTMRDFIGSGESDLFAKTRRFGRFLRSREAAGEFWYGMASSGLCTSRARIFDRAECREREFLLFASNNYLGLANHPRVIDAIAAAVRDYGATNTGSRLIGGTTDLHLQLEQRLARFKGREDCIVFPSGYSANLGTISALLGANDVAITDACNHMSIQDGCKLSGAARKIYAHNDMDALEAVLQRADDRPGGRLIVADGVFSMHGDIVDLPGLVRLARKYGAKLLIDDAHATGVLGATGSGTAEHFGMKGMVDLEVGTMSKALGGQGGFVVGDKEVIDYLRFYANAYVFAATIPATVAAGLIAALDVLEAEPERLRRLWENVSYLKSALDAIGFDTERSASAIIPIVIGDEGRAMALGRSVRRRGMFCQTVVFPGVAVGDARLRISVLESHTRDDLDEAVRILIESAREHGLLPH
ncbi:8-amino-7-oxononanoate synthase [Cupriavidus sp. USMAHM13]|uniref:aminotransferase class I/II-fold pyridoxal phosphate-dependent enzyme n=1 Tax=Cupriavidus sp. USMAHM13 TaxID=1389192 RepID=UPI0008A701D9|nr:aminotransferase class I/II-fold pyridoxal phosphate-dependent enzyme [Cupriavidus sp. USMAHM13]AOZ02111.1 8-amino-7-oxononanoate synthase [Cupriavidus sp. USMAHM13]